MIKIFFIAILLVGGIAHSQNSYPTKSQLLKSLTKKTSFKKNVYNSTNWFTLESDSSFNTADTIIFYNNRNIKQDKLICNFIEWNFYKKDAFWKEGAQLCKEPTTGTLATFFTFRISDSLPYLTLRIFNKGMIVDEFEVLSLKSESLPENTETFEILILRRRRIR